MKFAPQMCSKCIRHSASPCGPAAACSCAAKAKWAVLSGRAGHWRTQAECSSGDREMVRLDPDSTESRRAALDKATDDAMAAVPEADYVKGQPPFARAVAVVRVRSGCALIGRTDAFEGCATEQMWPPKCAAHAAAKIRRTRGRPNPPHTRSPKSAAGVTFSKQTFLSS